MSHALHNGLSEQNFTEDLGISCWSILYKTVHMCYVNMLRIYIIIYVDKFESVICIRVVNVFSRNGLWNLTSCIVRIICVSEIVKLNILRKK
jgi:hypothetical protein